MNSNLDPHLSHDSLSPPQKSTDLVLDFGQIFGILKRGWWVIAVAGFIGTLIAIILVFQVTPSYTSSAKLLLGQKSRIDDVAGALFPDLRLDDAAVSGEIAILTSARLLSQVSQSLDLDSHPEFNPALIPQDDGPGYVEQATDWAVGLIKLAMGIDETEPPPTESPESEQESPIRNAAMTGKRLLGDQSDYVDILGVNLRVSQQGRSNLLSIRYISGDRLLAAAVPNTLVDFYLTDQVDRRFEVLSRVNSGLEARLETMRERLEESERAVIEFRNRNQSKGFGSLSQMEQQLTDLSARISAAKAEHAGLISDLDGIDTMIEKQGALATVGLSPSPIVEAILTELNGLRERAARLNSQSGEGVPQRVHSEIERLEASLTNEIIRLRDDRARVVELSARRISALQAELRALEQQAIAQAEREVRLAQLEREQSAAQVVYATFLDRFTETREVIDLQEGDAQIIDFADPPPAPFAPNKKLSAALGGLAGGFIGIALIFILHLTRHKVSTAADLSRLLPAFSVVPMPRVRRLFGRADPLGVVLRPNPSPHSEAIRSLRSTVLLSAPTGMPAVVSVVSPLASAGKTMVAINLARSIARVGRSCVLVDADLRRGDVARHMKLDTTLELYNLLVSQHSDPEASLQKDHETDLRVITAQRGITDPAEALLSKDLPLLLSKLKDRFEVVIIDTMPLLSGSDAMPLVQHSDAVVMVVPRGSNVDEVRVASGKLNKFDVPNRSAVLNFVSEKEAETYY